MPRREIEPCCVVDAQCEAPAGYRCGNGIAEGDRSARCTCTKCGQRVCKKCSKVIKRERICNYCLEAGY